MINSPILKIIRYNKFTVESRAPIPSMNWVYSQSCFCDIVHRAIAVLLIRVWWYQRIALSGSQWSSLMTVDIILHQHLNLKARKYSYIILRCPVRIIGQQYSSCLLHISLDIVHPHHYFTYFPHFWDILHIFLDTSETKKTRYGIAKGADQKNRPTVRPFFFEFRKTVNHFWEAYQPVLEEKANSILNNS